MKREGLLTKLRKCKPQRDKYYIKPTINFKVDTHDYYMAFLPTILWCPWIFRYPNSRGIVDIWWLHFHILIGTWVPKED